MRMKMATLISKIPRARSLAPWMCLCLLLSLNAVAQNRVVLVENTDVGRLHYPVYITGELGFRVHCESQAAEDAILVGLGMGIPPSEVLDPFSAIVTASNPAEQPPLCPQSENYLLKLFSHDAGEGRRFYVQFPDAIGSTHYTDSLYVPACTELLDALQVDRNTAVVADPEPFFGNNIHEIECISGTTPDVAPTTFSQWCTRGDLDAQQTRTVLAVLSLTPQGEAALGDAIQCDAASGFLGALTSLNLADKALETVTPLAALTTLTSLNLANNRIDDIGALFNLPALTSLNVADNAIENIAALGAFTALTEVNLMNNSVADLRPLSTLGVLQKAYLGGNSIEDVSALGHLLALTELDLSNNLLESDDIQDLTGLSALQILNLAHNRIDSVEHLSQLPSTVAISLVGNPAYDANAGSFIEFCVLHRQEPTPLGFTVRKLVEVSGTTSCEDSANHLESIAELNLSGMGLTDITPITLLSNLRSLDVSGNSIVDIAGIDRLQQLTSLLLANNSVQDIRAVGRLPTLDTFDVSNNPVSINDYLSACLVREHEGMLSAEQLTEINALFEHSAQSHCLDSAVQLSRLSVVELRGKSLTSVNYFPVLSQVKTLDLASNLLTDVSALSPLTTLTHLQLSDNRIERMDGFRAFKQLTHLYLRDNPTRHLGGLRDMERLVHVDLVRTRVKNILELGQAPALQSASVTQLPIIHTSFESYCLMRKFDKLASSSFRTFIDAVLPIAASADVDVNDCRAAGLWAGSIESLNLNKKRITNLSPLSHFKNLKELYLHGNRLSNVQPVASLSRLLVLNLSDNTIRALPNLSSQNLKSLYIQNNALTSVSSVKRLKQLERLRLDGNHLVNPSSLKQLKKLSYLDLRNNRIAAFNVASPLVATHNAYLKGNPICTATHLTIQLAQACAREPKPVWQVQLNDLQLNGERLNRNLVRVPVDPGIVILNQ